MIRPIITPITQVNTVSENVPSSAIAFKVISLAAILGIFTFAVWIMLRKSKEELNSPKTVPALLASAGVGLILLLLYGVSLTAVKGMILCMILLWASLSDIAKHEAPDFITAFILVLAYVGFEPANLPSMLIGASMIFVPQIAISILRPKRAIGGADIKISTALAFLLGVEKGIFALLIGMTTGVIVMLIVRKIRRETTKEPFALIPFLSLGAMLSFIL